MELMLDVISSKTYAGVFSKKFCDGNDRLEHRATCGKYTPCRLRNEGLIPGIKLVSILLELPGARKFVSVNLLLRLNHTKIERHKRIIERERYQRAHRGH